ncbi:MAG: U32 family peptidase [Rhodanobacteraceae bacterium]|jgi:collagenase-like PrtC family protease|nr:U32 family peptidase [Rhodanobacteraceae bacterium]MBL0041252.1 U32 family peptidase [Xanthomonadales bacterium]MBP6079267.1 U32 family peptidase [Xanthomonadales bacterium]MBP7624658.1 U32 family peptidase [Xanthomonadales bacterium]
MQLSLGPLQYFWARDRTLAFYREAATWPLDRIHLGETVCSKRRELGTRDWIALAEQLAASGKQIVLSTLALIEAESELGALRRIVDHSRFLIEANDLSAVQYCRQRGLPFVAGPTLNIYNAQALSLLIEDGLRRWVPGVEQGHDLIAELRMATGELGQRMPELEVIAWGRLPLAFSARCFTARALDLAKDDCGFRCIEHPDGLPLATREGERFLRINGIQIQGDEITDLAPEIAELRALGVDALRLYPQHEGMAEVVTRFRAALDADAPIERVGAVNGYWRAAPGKPGLPLQPA